MANQFEALRRSLIERSVRGPGTTAPAAREAAFANTGVPEGAKDLVDTVAKNAWKVTDEQVAAAAQQLPEDAVFELVVCAAMGQASRQLEAARAALAAVTKEQA